MAIHSIQLTRSAQLPHNLGNLQGFRFTVVAHDAVGMPVEIFRMYDQTLDPVAQTRTAVYDGVANIADLANLPINAAVPPEYHFRVDHIDVDYTSELDGEAAWESIESDVDSLVESLAASGLLVVEETVQFSAG
jgi:hypothetical protein